MKQKIIIPRQNNLYSSFPTMTTDDKNLYIFYRRAKTDEDFVHGYYGKVNVFKIERQTFLKAMQSDEPMIFSHGEHETVFSSTKQNEIDAIVSKLDKNLYSLVTRQYLPKKLNQPYISVSDSLSFSDRKAIQHPNIQWFVLYGKAFKSNDGYIFPAYGSLTSEPGQRPFLLQTDDFTSWSILSTLPLNEDYILNESSIVFHDGLYTIFMRDNKLPFRIWTAESSDLKQWTKPAKLMTHAHAPMTLLHNNKLFLTFRDLSINKKWSTSLIEPFSSKKKIILDRYEGNPYDGGYSDLLVMDEQLICAYYSGNEDGEPEIKCSMINLAQV